LRDIELVNKRIHHGLSYSFSNSALSKQKVRVCGDGVFPKLYELLLGKTLPKNQELNIMELLGYCTDIQTEYEFAEIGRHKNLPGFGKIIITDNHSSFPLIGIAKFDQIKNYPDAEKKFDSYFEEVKLELEEGNKLFGIANVDQENFSFYKSKKIYRNLPREDGILGLVDRKSINQDLRKTLHDYLVPLPYKSLQHFNLSMPLRAKEELPFNEVLAIYVVVFYLGNLVRYNPQYLEDLLGSSDLWIIERFIKSSTITFLRSFSNLILEKDYIYVSR